MWNLSHHLGDVSLGLLPASGVIQSMAGSSCPVQMPHSRAGRAGDKMIYNMTLCVQFEKSTKKQLGKRVEMVLGIFWPPIKFWPSGFLRGDHDGHPWIWGSRSSEHYQRVTQKRNLMWVSWDFMGFLWWFSGIWWDLKWFTLWKTYKKNDGKSRISMDKSSINGYKWSFSMATC